MTYKLRARTARCDQSRYKSLIVDECILVLVTFWSQFFLALIEAVQDGKLPVHKSRIGLRMVTDIANGDEGLRHLKERAPLLKPREVS